MPNGYFIRFLKAIPELLLWQKLHGGRRQEEGGRRQEAGDRRQETQDCCILKMLNIRLCLTSVDIAFAPDIWKFRLIACGLSLVVG